MDEDVKKMLKEGFERLPKDLQDAILSTDISGKLKEVSEKNGLRTDQGTALENEVIMTIMNLEPIEDLSSNIETSLGVNKQKAGEIAVDVNERIFKSIRGSMQSLQESDSLAEEKLEGEEKEENLDRSQILREIENPEMDKGKGPKEESHEINRFGVGMEPREISPQKPDIFEEKFQKTTSLPKEEIEVDLDTGGGEKMRPKSEKIDPYREPIE